MREQLTNYKWKKLAVESFKNGLRLHFDSILLYNNKSFPSAYHLSILALEEFGKSYWIYHYYYSSITNDGFPEKEFEQKWLKLLFIHKRKQTALFNYALFDGSWPKFFKRIELGELEYKKQKAIYVGLKRSNNGIDVNGRILLPEMIKEKDARQAISFLSMFLKEKCEMKFHYGDHFCIEEMDKLLSNKLYKKLLTWPYNSKLLLRKSFLSGLKDGSRKKSPWKKDCQRTLNRINKIKLSDSI